MDAVFKKILIFLRTPLLMAPFKVHFLHIMPELAILYKELGCYIPLKCKRNLWIPIFRTYLFYNSPMGLIDLFLGYFTNNSRTEFCLRKLSINFPMKIRSKTLFQMFICLLELCKQTLVNVSSTSFIISVSQTDAVSY